MNGLVKFTEGVCIEGKVASTSWGVFSVIPPYVGRVPPTPLLHPPRASYKLSVVTLGHQLQKFGSQADSSPGLGLQEPEPQSPETQRLKVD